MNELEERRVIRLLDGIAVDPLPAEQVGELLHTATLGAGGRRRSRLLPRVLAVGAAAALILGTALTSSLPGSQSSPSGRAGAPAHLASFPEGSALHLLLSSTS
jgi:hypothetical protein